MPLIIAVLLLVASVAPLVAQGATRLPAQPPAHSGATVSGQVRSDRTNGPLRHATIELVAPGVQPITAVSDSNGVYVIRDVPTGRRMLRATHLDHAPNEIELLIVAERRHFVDFDLAFRPVRLNAVTAEGTRPLITDSIAIRPADLGAAN